MKHVMLLSMLPACGAGVASEYVPLGPARAARATSDVAVFLVDRPKAAFHEVGLVSVFQSGVVITGPSFLPEVIAELRVAGGQHGCDAVIANPPQLVGSHWLVTGTCIAYDVAQAVR